ncbi:hypothetical protein MJO47_00730 [Desulfuromonas sp. KJ2020]|uniref:hypothetical protein n=1 Tax=Desulfuromonas sp. KJ2020 TaxID=2919173 RepID=UPI0020A806BB|nr:hypothetical protein [Desulfuromonas sp. KJ2020]MCP3175616.1 hypothetical protein [Desulfuromonas sp. KJ2020]
MIFSLTGLWRQLVILAILLLFSGCAWLPTPAPPPVVLQVQEDGTSVWQDEFAFVPPPAPWELVQLDEDDYSLAYMKLCRDSYPCQSTLAYAEEPFGYSLDFERRVPEFFKRFLWASRVQFAKPTLEKTTLFGKEALIADTEGIEPVKGHKVWSKIVFARRGERVVAFYYTQWRPAEADYDQADVEAFDRFVETFRYLKPSFYETL